MFILTLVRALAHENVTFAIAGGYAVALHGAVRGTLDVDIVLSLHESSYVKCEKALLSIGLQSKLPVTAAQVFQFRKEYIQARNLIAWSFYDPKDPTNIVDIIITYEKTSIPTKMVKFQGERLPVLDIKELIKMKKNSGRPQDLEDIKALEKLS